MEPELPAQLMQHIDSGKIDNNGSTVHIDDMLLAEFEFGLPAAVKPDRLEYLANDASEPSKQGKICIN